MSEAIVRRIRVVVPNGTLPIRAVGVNTRSTATERHCNELISRDGVLPVVSALHRKAIAGVHVWSRQIGHRAGEPAIRVLCRVCRLARNDESDSPNSRRIVLLDRVRTGWVDHECSHDCNCNRGKAPRKRASCGHIEAD